MAGTTVADDGSVIAAFSAAVEQFGLPQGTPGYGEALAYVHRTMGQSKIEVFRHILGAEEAAQKANGLFEEHYAASVQGGAVAALPGAAETIAALRAAGIKVCLATGFSPATRDALLDALGAGLVAGVLTGSGSREELEQAGAPVILDTIAALPPLVGING